jgi:hypothetical protein
MCDRRPRRRHGDPDGGEQLSVPECRLVRPDEELRQRHPAPVEVRLRVQREQERRRVGVRVREAEVAAEGADVPDADVRHPALHRRQ